MISIDDFRKEVEQIDQILFTIILLSEDYNYFFNQSEELIEKVLIPYKKIIRIKLATLRYLNLELITILDEDETHSIKKFLNKLINNYSHSEWKSKVSLLGLCEIEEQINNILKSETYLKMKILRNKHLAHKDRKRNEYLVEWTPFEIIEIAKQCESIMNMLKLKILNEQTFYDFSSIEIGNNLFTDLLKFKNLGDKIFEAYKKDPNSIFRTEILFHWYNRNQELSWE